MTQNGSKQVDPLFKDLAPGEDEDPQIIKLRELHGKGYSLRQISGEVGRSREWCRLKLKELYPDEEKPSTRPKDTTPILFFDNETLSFMLSYPFNYMAKRYGDFWKLSEDEEKELSKLVNRVSSKWIPRWLVMYADEIGLIQVIFLLVYPRYAQTQEMIKEKTEKKEAEKTKPSPETAQVLQ